MTRFVPHIIIILILLISSPVAFAQEVFLDNDDVRVVFPAGIHTADCSPELAAKAGDACIRLGEDGQAGVVFWRVSSGYSLTAPGALDKHIRQSVDALANIPNIEVINAWMLQTTPPIGAMEVRRSDSSVSELTSITPLPVIQTSILIPLGNRLGQMFIYTPENSGSSAELTKQLVGSVAQNIEVRAAPVNAPQPESSPTGILPAGSFSLLPRALLWGGAAALLIILVLHIFARRRAKNREND